MKKNSFYLGVFIVSWLLIIIGIVLGYLYASYNIKHVNSQSSQIVSFENLPENVKSKYVKKEDVIALSEQLSIDKEEIIPPDEPIVGNNDELKALIRTLREKNQALYQDNIGLSDKSWELSQKLLEKDKILQDNKNQVCSENLDAINQAEAQHYKNINDLRKRINVLEKDAIDITKKYEEKIVALDNQIDNLTKSLHQKELEIDSQINAATQKERINNTTLAEKNRYLLEQVNQMKAKLSQEYEDNAKTLKSKKDELLHVKEELNAKDVKINELLSKHTKDILVLEQKSTKSINEFREYIKSLQNKHREEIVVKNQEISNLMLKQKQELEKLKITLGEKEVGVQKYALEYEKQSKKSSEDIRALQNQIKQLQKEKQAVELQVVDMEDKIKKISANKQDEYAKAVLEVKQSLLSEKNITNKAIEDLQDRILEAAGIIDEYKQQVQNLTKELNEYKQNENNKISLKEYEFKEQKHAQNYKTLNDKILILQAQKQKIFDEAKKQIDSIKDTINVKNEQLLAEKKEQTQKFASLNDSLHAFKVENENLKTQIQNEKNAYSSKNSKIIEDLNTTKSKLVHLNDEFLALKNQNITLQNENKMLKNENEKSKVAFEDYEKNISSTLKAENLKLNNDNDGLKKSIQNLREVAKTSEENFKDKIVKLNDELQQMYSKILKLEQKSQKLQDLNIKLTSDNNNLALAAENSTSTLQTKNELLNTKIQSLQNELSGAKEALDNLKNDNNLAHATITNLKNDLKNQVSTLQNRFDNASETLKFSQNKVMSYKDQISSLEKENELLMKENEVIRKDTSAAKELYSTKEQKLSQKLDESQKMLDQKDEQIKTYEQKFALQEAKYEEYKNNLKDENIQILDDAKKHLQTKYDETMSDLRNRKAEILALKNDVQNLKEQNALLQNQADTLKNIEVENNNDELVLRLQNELTMAKNENDELRKNTQNKPKISKMQLFGSIKCDDMKVGSNEPSATCKQNVKEFLTKYDAGYYFEVVPIVDNGGFASLKKVQKSNIGIANSEIQRLTRLSNIGLGKDRSAQGGELIRQMYGDYAKISYAVSNLDIANKRGFVIRAYK